MVNLKSIVVAASIGAMSYFVYPHFNNTLIYNPKVGLEEAYADEIDDLVRAKKILGSLKQNRKEMKYGSAFIDLIRLSYIEDDTISGIVSELLPDIKIKLEQSEQSSYKIFIDNFENSSSDPTIAKRLVAMLKKTDFSMSLTIIDNKNLADIILEGEVLSYNAERNESIFSKTIKYATGSSEIENLEYRAAMDEYYRAQEKYGEARANSSGGTLGEAVNIMYNYKGARESAKSKDAYGTIANIANGLQGLSNIANISSAKSGVDAAAIRLQSVPLTKEQTDYDLYTSQKTIVKKEGLIEINLRFTDKRCSSLLEDTITASVNVQDSTEPEFIPAGIRGDPLEIISDLQLREATIAAGALAIAKYDVLGVYLSREGVSENRLDKLVKLLFALERGSSLYNQVLNQVSEISGVDGTEIRRAMGSY